MELFEALVERLIGMQQPAASSQKQQEAFPAGAAQRLSAVFRKQPSSALTISSPVQPCYSQASEAVFKFMPLIVLAFGLSFGLQRYFA